MALRIKSHWHDDDAERSLDEIAGALAFISWRVAKDRAINLHGQDFVYETDEQRFQVIIEYLIFQLQIIDRLAMTTLELGDQDRQQLVVTVARHLAGHLHDNSVDIFGPGDYVGPFIRRLNERSANTRNSVTAGMGLPTPSCVTSATRSSRSWVSRRRTAG